MLRRGGALISGGLAAQDSLRAIAATEGSSLLLGASAPSTLHTALCCSACSTSASSGCCCCSSSSAHAPVCGCSACAALRGARATFPAGTSSWLMALTSSTSHATCLTRAVGTDSPGPVHLSAPSPAVSLPFSFSLRGLHTSAAVPSAAAPAPAADAGDAPAERGRRSRRPAAADAPSGPAAGGARGRQRPASLLPSDGEAGEEVQAVLDKLVGGLIQGGRKGTARRIVEDALLQVRRQLKKGGLEELK